MKHVFYIILTVKTAADVGPTSPRRRPDVGWTSAIDLGPTSARRRLDLGWTSVHAGISDIQPTSCRGWTDVGPTSACLLGYVFFAFNLLRSFSINLTKKS